MRLGLNVIAFCERFLERGIVNLCCVYDSRWSVLDCVVLLELAWEWDLQVRSMSMKACV